MPSQPLGPSSQSKQKADSIEPAPPKASTIVEKENLGGKDASFQDQPLFAPQTPGRISLADLVANPEDFLQQLPSATPYEQVTWKHVPGLLQSPPSSLRTTQRSRKRAHSSSPVSSQNRRSKHFREDGDAMDMKSISQSLHRSPTRRSPNHDDPAAILWNNYAEKRANEPVLPPLPPLELSPHTPNGSKKDNTFRRTASCGNEWPTSKAKRRKLVHYDPHSTTKQIFASRRKEILRPELPQQSKVSILLESVQQSFVARAREPDEPSSSSPLPERFEPEHLQAKPSRESRQQSNSPGKHLQPVLAMPHGSSPLKGRHDKSSDYGDFDFDEDDLEVIEAALTQGHAQLKSKNTVSAKVAPDLYTKDILDEVQPSAKTPQSQTKMTQGTGARLGGDQTSKTKYAEITACDDFDDDDDDELFNNELQQLAEKVDSQQAGLPHPSIVQRTSSLAGVLDGAFENEFDEDIMNELCDNGTDVTRSNVAGKEVRR